jgi:hypothetical protein
MSTSVADPHHVDANPDPAYHFDANTYPACHFDADPNPKGSKKILLSDIYANDTEM